jgi:drug efflux transport system permease protein
VIRRLRQMLIKELIQLFRDPKSRFALFAPVLIQIVVFGYAATFEIRHVPTAVLDYDNSYESRDLLSRFQASEYFDVRYRVHNDAAVRRLIDASDVAIAIKINAGFSELLRKNYSAPVQVILDGTNSNTALIALGYVSDVASRFAAEYERDRMERVSPAMIDEVPSVRLEQRPWYNPDLDSHWFFIPGLIGTIILVTVVQLTAFAIVRERELGTLEQLMVTPISRFEFVVGKTVPFFLVGIADTLVIALIGSFWFGVPMRGNIMVLMLGASLFLLSSLGIGLLISNSARTQQQSMVSGFFFLMPAIILSGFGTPISSMPQALQYFTLINPLRYFLEVVRGVYLKGVGLDILWPDMVAMAIIGVLLLVLTATRVRKSID